MAVTSLRWRNAMNREQRQKRRDRLFDLGVASAATKGGPMGAEDSERTLFLHGIGLARD
jgi:hypothetical protein